MEDDAGYIQIRIPGPSLVAAAACGAVSSCVDAALRWACSSVADGAAAAEAASVTRTLLAQVFSWERAGWVLRAAGTAYAARGLGVAAARALPPVAEFVERTYPARMSYLRAWLARLPFSAFQFAAFQNIQVLVTLAICTVLQRTAPGLLPARFASYFHLCDAGCGVSFHRMQHILHACCPPMLRGVLLWPARGTLESAAVLAVERSVTCAELVAVELLQCAGRMAAWEVVIAVRASLGALRKGFWEATVSANALHAVWGAGLVAFAPAAYVRVSLGIPFVHLLPLLVFSQTNLLEELRWIPIVLFTNYYRTRGVVCNTIFPAAYLLLSRQAALADEQDDDAPFDIDDPWSSDETSLGSSDATDPLHAATVAAAAGFVGVGDSSPESSGGGGRPLSRVPVSLQQSFPINVSSSFVLSERREPRVSLGVLATISGLTQPTTSSGSAGGAGAGGTEPRGAPVAARRSIPRMRRLRSVARIGVGMSPFDVGAVVTASSERPMMSRAPRAAVRRAGAGASRFGGLGASGAPAASAAGGSSGGGGGGDSGEGAGAARIDDEDEALLDLLTLPPTLFALPDGSSGGVPEGSLRSRFGGSLSVSRFTATQTTNESRLRGDGGVLGASLSQVSGAPLLSTDSRARNGDDSPRGGGGGGGGGGLVLEGVASNTSDPLGNQAWSEASDSEVIQPEQLDALYAALSPNNASRSGLGAAFMVPASPGSIDPGIGSPLVATRGSANRGFDDAVPEDSASPFLRQAQRDEAVPDPQHLTTTVVVEQSHLDEWMKTGERCAICLGGYSIGEVVRSLTRCSHAFHSECVDRWLSRRSQCPLCREKTTTRRGGSAASPAEDWEAEEEMRAEEEHLEGEVERWTREAVEE